MPNLDSFMKWGGKAGSFITDRDRESDTDFKIGHQSVSIVFYQEDGTARAAQDVYAAPISAGGGASQVSDDAGDAGSSDLLLIGRETLTVIRGDRFTLGGTRYEVMYVDRSMNGKTEVRAESRQ
jgi:hypothetical protein